MVNLAPIPVSGASLNVQVPSGPFPQGTQDEIRISNETPFQCTVSCAGTSLSLDPYTADVFKPPQRVTQLAVSFLGLSSPLAPAPTSQLAVSFAEPGETIPGVYPMAVAGNPQPLQQQLAGSPFSPALNSTGQVGFSVNGAIQQLAILLSNPAAVTLLTVQGFTSGYLYVSDKPSVSGRSLYLLNVLSAVDTVITVAATVSGAQTSVVNVVEVSGLAPAYNVAPPLSQVPNKPPLVIAATIAGGGGSLALVSGASNQNLYLFYCHLTQDAVASTTIELRDTSDNVLDNWDPNLAGLSPGIYFGAPVGVGKGCKLVNNGPNQAILRGCLVYSQG